MFSFRFRDVNSSWIYNQLTFHSAKNEMHFTVRVYLYIQDTNKTISLSALELIYALISGKTQNMVLGFHAPPPTPTLHYKE